MNSVEKVVIKYPKDDLEAYVSPGTAAMQTAWYLLAVRFKNLKIFQVDPPKFRNGKPPQKRWIKIIESDVPKNINYYHETSRKKTNYNTKETIVTKSMERFYARAKKIALTHDATTLILGETGTGKEFIARYIHEQSAGRSKKDMISVNCAQLGDDLLESRLFGTVKGAYTDAIDTPGAFKEANNSTLFLDEIGDISEKMQKTLLRALETKEISPVGDFKSKYKVDVRVIAATHQKLFDLVKEGKFRRDLYHRLYIADVETIPYKFLPEQEKQELFEFINEKMRVKYRVPENKKLSYSKDALQTINSYDFPGNIRELKHLIERLYVFCESEVVLEDLPNRIKYLEVKKSLKLEDAKERHILMVYNMCNKNYDEAAKILGKGGKQTIVRKVVKKYYGK